MSFIEGAGGWLGTIWQSVINVAVVDYRQGKKSKRLREMENQNGTYSTRQSEINR